jgi:hypothetical protein
LQARSYGEIPPAADLEIGGTAGLETCATGGAESAENVEEAGIYPVTFKATSFTMNRA